jgi:hypothetical protein
MYREYEKSRDAGFGAKCPGFGGEGALRELYLLLPPYLDKGVK